MIFYNNVLAKSFLKGKKNHYFRIGWFFFYPIQVFGNLGRHGTSNT